MQPIGISIFILVLNFSSVAHSETLIQCDQSLEVSWLFNPEENTSKFSENKQELNDLTIKLDRGLIKAPLGFDTENQLFRQIGIVRNVMDPTDLTVRYENLDKRHINNKSIILSDPMCRNHQSANLNIFETFEIGYQNSFYTCECLSATYDAKHFMN